MAKASSFEITHHVEEEKPGGDMELEPAPSYGVSSGTRQRAEQGKRESEKERGEAEGEGKGKKKRRVEMEESVEEKAILGPKEFGSAVEMLDYFHKLLHSWPPNLDVNEYERMVLLDLLKKGHPAPQEKIGGGINAFQVRRHPLWKTKCFFLLRLDGSADDFSFRKCVDRILPLPESMKAPSPSCGNMDVEKSRGHHGGNKMGSPQREKRRKDGKKKARGAQMRGGRGWRGRGRRGGSANKHGVYYF